MTLNNIRCSATCVPQSGKYATCVPQSRKYAICIILGKCGVIEPVVMNTCVRWDGTPRTCIPAQVSDEEWRLL
jgi:hypothetical protein